MDANREDLTLADRCWNYEKASEELWDSVNKIMGGTWPAHEDSPVTDTWTDPYDSSVEVVLQEDGPRMTREQADAILALGFSQIYESHGDTGAQWTKTHQGKCSPRTNNGDPLKSLATRAKLKDALDQVRTLQQTLNIVSESRDVYAEVLAETQAEVRALEGRVKTLIYEHRHTIEQRGAALTPA